MISQAIDFMGPDLFQRDFARPILLFARAYPEFLSGLIEAISSASALPSLSLENSYNIALLFRSTHTTPSAFNAILHSSYQPKGFLGWRSAPADLNILDKNGNTLLIRAVMSGNFEMVEHFLDNSFPLLRHKNSLGKSAYDVAIYMGESAKIAWPPTLLERLKALADTPSASQPVR
jgi:hypothetical protein